MKKAKSTVNHTKPEVRVNNHTSSDPSTYSDGNTNMSQEHARPRTRQPLDTTILSPHMSASDISTSISNTSLSSSISR